jgi:hypothetical protein
MSDRKRDPLDAALGRLPRDVPPSRDLWPGIEAQLSKPAVEDAPVSPRRGMSFRWMQLAAGVLVLVATAVTTHVVTRESMKVEMAASQTPTGPAPVETGAAPLAQGVPAAYVQALGDSRAQLEAAFRERIASLPPVTRAKLERDLDDLRRAARDIANTLSEHPSDPLLQELLMSTYQSELDLLSNVGEMATATSVRTDL